MGSLLPLRSKALLIELVLAIALSSAVIAFSGGITPQSYKNALIVAALVLAPLEALRQAGVLEQLVGRWRKRRAQSEVRERQAEAVDLEEHKVLHQRGEQGDSLSLTDTTETTDASGAIGGVDRGTARDLNEAAARFAETLAESYRGVYEQAAESGERQRRLAQEFSELVADNLREQEARQELARESVEAYAEFLDDAFSRYREGTERAAESAREASDAVADRADAAMETIFSSIEDHGEMNMEEVSKRLNDLMDRKIRAT